MLEYKVIYISPPGILEKALNALARDGWKVDQALQNGTVLLLSRELKWVQKWTRQDNGEEKFSAEWERG